MSAAHAVQALRFQAVGLVGGNSSKYEVRPKHPVPFWFSWEGTWADSLLPQNSSGLTKSRMSLSGTTYFDCMYA